MKQKLLSSLALLFGFVQLQAVEINVTSPVGEIVTTSSGGALDSNFTFALGSFGAFSPNSSNLSLWGANFTTVPTGGSSSWVDPFGFSISATITNNNAPFSIGSQAYVWGYNSQTVTVGSEWVLLTNVAWTIPSSANLLPTNWDISDSGTTAVFGSIAALGSSPFVSTAAVVAQAIPEPSTYAAIFGALALGLVAYRRRMARTA